MVRRSYTETIDLNTEVGGPSLLGLHTPIGGDAYDFLRPFFQAYKKYKYLGMNVTIVNSARLPYDPEQIGKVEGENYVDPRDSLNPILFKGCHGESLGPILDSIYEGLASDVFKLPSIDREDAGEQLENFYYTALGDDSWRKSPVQKTLRIKGLHPLVYNLATNRQIAPSNEIEPADYMENSTDADALGLSPSTHQAGRASPSPGSDLNRAFITNPNAVMDHANGITKYRVAQSMFTNKCTRLGWMDTLQIAGNKNVQPFFNKAQVAMLPKLFMGILMLPPAYLTRNYLRIIIEHKFAFSGYRTITTGGNSQDVYVSSHGYHNQMTGNIPNTEEGNSKVPDVVGQEARSDPLGGAIEEADIDYDAIEEVDSDE